MSFLARLTGSIARQSATHVAAALLLFAAAATPAAAQTLQLTDSSATTLRGGAYASTNYSSATTLESRASSDPSYARRVLLKFDTHNTIPVGSQIVSAILTVTVAGGNAETRTIGAYRETSSYDEGYATWTRRNSSANWSAAGGDIAQLYDLKSVTNVAGSRVSFDLTKLVSSVVSETFGTSRYTRVVLVDAGGDSRDSYKQYYSDEASTASLRPVLTIVLGTSTPPPSPAPTPAPAPAPSGSGVKLRVLQWNLHHGVGTDGKYDIDRIATWMAKMNPDVIMSNEVERNTGWGSEDQPARYRSLLQTKTGRTWYYHFAQEFGDWTSSGKGHLILSKYPFDSTSHVTTTPSSGLMGAGAVSQAAILVNGRRINLIIGHLDPSSQSMRLTQAREVINWASGYPENRIITGDMNAWPDQSSIAEYNKTYYDSWTVATGKGTAYQYAGLAPDGATKNGRIDYVLFSKNAPNLVVISSQVYDTRDASGNKPSDHRPVLTTFEVR